MRFNKHSHLEGLHAFLSPSNYHWTNYDKEKLLARYRTTRAAQRGTELHALAHSLIKHRQYLRDDPPTTMSLYVRDCIDHNLRPEQTLFYSIHCFGTPDAIGLTDNHLTVNDLKTGVSKTNVRQLEVYAAIFCLEYGIDPLSLTYTFRIYQHDEIRQYEGIPVEIEYLTRVIVESSALLDLEAEKEDM